MDLNELEKVERCERQGPLSGKWSTFVRESYYDQALSLIRAQQELLRAYRHEEEKVEVEWSDRRSSYHPSEFWAAVMNCALDHSYDRVNDGIPYGIPHKFEKAFAPIVRKHLSAVCPEWENKTVYLDKVQSEAFEQELRAANESLLAADALLPPIEEK